MCEDDLFMYAIKLVSLTFFTSCMQSFCAVLACFWKEDTINSVGLRSCLYQSKDHRLLYPPLMRPTSDQALIMSCQTYLYEEE